MHDQPRFIPLRPSEFFEDGRSARPLPEGPWPAATWMTTPPSTRAKAPMASRSTLSVPVTKETIVRGQDRFNIYCAPCHDHTGYGNGMIVQRRFRHPPSFHTDKIRQLSNGFIFDVITKGFGAMQDYAAQISPRDRWAIVAYVRALQLSQNALLTTFHRNPHPTRRREMTAQLMDFNVSTELQADLKRWRSGALAAGIAGAVLCAIGFLRLAVPVLPLLPVVLRIYRRPECGVARLADAAISHRRRLGRGHPAAVRGGGAHASAGGANVRSDRGRHPQPVLVVARQRGGRQTQSSSTNRSI